MAGIGDSRFSLSRGVVEAYCDPIFIAILRPCHQLHLFLFLVRWLRRRWNINQYGNTPIIWRMSLTDAFRKNEASGSKSAIAHGNQKRIKIQKHTLWGAALYMVGRFAFVR